MLSLDRIRNIESKTRLAIAPSKAEEFYSDYTCQTILCNLRLGQYYCIVVVFPDRLGGWLDLCVYYSANIAAHIRSEIDRARAEESYEFD